MLSLQFVSGPVICDKVRQNSETDEQKGLERQKKMVGEVSESWEKYSFVRDGRVGARRDN